jgi:hypothetical protein
MRTAWQVGDGDWSKMSWGVQETMTKRADCRRGHSPNLPWVHTACTQSLDRSLVKTRPRLASQLLLAVDIQLRDVGLPRMARPRSLTRPINWEKWQARCLLPALMMSSWNRVHVAHTSCRLIRSFCREYLKNSPHGPGAAKPILISRIWLAEPTLDTDWADLKRWPGAVEFSSISTFK